MRIKTIEERSDKNGNAMKVVTTEDDTKVFVNSKFEGEVFNTITGESEVEVEKQGDFWKIKPESLGITVKPKSSGGYRNEQIKEAQSRKESSISKAQDRTELMWAKNGAWNLVANHFAYKELSEDEIKTKVRELTSFIVNLKGEDIEAF